MIQIGEVVKYIRKSKRIRRDDLAMMSGVNLNTLKNIETGRNATLKSVERVLDAMGYELEIVKK